MVKKFFFINMLSSIISLALIVVSSRKFGISNYGYYAEYIIFQNIFALLVNFNLTSYYERSRRDNETEVRVVYALIFLLCFTLLFSISSLLSLDVLLFYGLFSGYFLANSSLAQSKARINGSIKQYVALVFSPPIFTLAAVLQFESIELVVFGNMIALFLIFLMVSRHLYGLHWKEVSLNKSYSFIRDSFLGIVGWRCIQQADKFFLSVYASSEVKGLYLLCYQVCQSQTIFQASLLRAWIPSYLRGDNQRSFPVYIFLAVSIFYISFGVLIYSFGPLVFEVQDSDFRSYILLFMISPFLSFVYGLVNASVLKRKLEKINSRIVAFFACFYGFLLISFVGSIPLQYMTIILASVVSLIIFTMLLYLIWSEKR